MNLYSCKGEMYMKSSYLSQYSDKSELEKLKVFLQEAESYMKLLSMGLSPKEVLSIVEEPFFEHITKTDVLEKIDTNQFNYIDESKKFGLNIEIDALAYACHRLNVDVNECEVIKKSIKKMKTRNQ